MNSIDTLHLAMASARPQEMREAAPASSSIQQWRLLHVFRARGQHRKGTDKRNPSTEEHSQASGRDRQSKSTDQGARQPSRRDRQSKSTDQGARPAIAMGPTIENPPTKEHGQPSRRTDNRNPSAALGEDRDHGGVGERSRSRREAANQASKAIVTTAIPPRTQILRAWVRETGRTGCRSEYAGDEPDSSSLRRRRTSLPRAEVKRWSWRANVLSYLATVGMLFVRLVFVSYAR